jgi:hypothetical protein
MKFPERLKPAIYGAVAGAVAIPIAGFSWGGWVTGSSAREMAADQARLDRVQERPQRSLHPAWMAAAGLAPEWRMLPASTTRTT